MVLDGIVAAGIGSAGVFTAWRARRSWRYPRALTVVLAIIGAGVTYEAYLHQLYATMIARPGLLQSEGPYDVHPLNGLLEVFGAIVLPDILYAALVVVLLVDAIRESLNWRLPE